MDIEKIWKALIEVLEQKYNQKIKIVEITKI